MSNAKLSVKNVQKSFQDAEQRLTVIDNLSFDFPESGSVAIIGRSGIGKSTLLNLLGGLELPTSGSIMHGSTDIATLSSVQRAAFRAKNVGFIFQFHHLLSEFSALENVAMPLLIADVSRSEALDRAETILDRVGLKSRLKHRPGQLSGGEQQRVSIARSLVHRPRLVLADEPTGNLDMRTARMVQDLLKETNSEFDNLLIIVTHLGELASAMDIVLEMEAGGALARVDKVNVGSARS